MTEKAVEKDPVVFNELKKDVEQVLDTYSNVHRGSGYFSEFTTRYLEEARQIVLSYLGLDKNNYVIIFCTPGREVFLKNQLKPGSWKCYSDGETGLHLGVSAMAVEKQSLPKGIPFQSGGGTARLISRNWVIWTKAPEKFEAGTPAIVNIILAARALQFMKESKNRSFRISSGTNPESADLLRREEFIDLPGQELLSELRKTMFGKQVQVPGDGKSRPFINLDYAASTPAFRPVADVFFRAMAAEGKQEIVSEVKSIISEVLGAPLSEYEVIFTSNTTESVNLAAENLKKEILPGTGTVIVNSLLEHNSNELPWRFIPGAEIIRLQADDHGFIDISELESLLSTCNTEEKNGRKKIRMVALTGASNVLGTCNDLRRIGEMVHKFGAQFLVDAAQLVAHRKINTAEWGIDYLAFSAHKVYAPFGTGVLIARKGLLRFDPDHLKIITSSGEANTGGIAALGKSLLLLQQIGFDRIEKEELELTARILKGMSRIPGIRIYGIHDPESPDFAKRTGVISFSLKGLYANKAAGLLAAKGIGLRYGCHCAHLLVKKLVNVSPFLEHFQRLILLLFPGVSLPGILRVSIGIGTTPEEIDAFTDVLTSLSQEQ